MPEQALITSNRWCSKLPSGAFPHLLFTFSFLLHKFLLIFIIISSHLSVLPPIFIIIILHLFCGIDATYDSFLIIYGFTNFQQILLSILFLNRKGMFAFISFSTFSPDFLLVSYNTFPSELFHYFPIFLCMVYSSNSKN